MPEQTGMPADAPAPAPAGPRMMRVGPVRVEFDGAHSLVAATIDAAGEREDLWFRVSGDRTGDRRPADAFLVLALLPAMRSAEVLAVDDAVSRRLLRSLPSIQSLVADWFPDLVNPVRIAARSRRVRTAAAAPVASCFTGGVDSFATLLSRREEIGCLFFVDGYDVPLARPDSLESVHGHLAAVGQETGTPLEVVATNARAFLLKHGQWGPLMHGAALAAAALVAAPGRFRRLVIPSGATERHLRPWGTHPLLDPLWSTEYLEVEHDAARLTRMEKVAVLRDDPVAQRHLRVCHRADGSYNCGECYKCMRTMATLDAHDALPDFRTFPPALDLDALRSLPARDATERRYTEWNLQLARTRPGKAELADALADALRGYDDRPD